ncbi:hypothetical protein EPI10_005859 [Gossypium australe]|uniref:Uncharacterized protein n=1 Tax=Gossypium australe TaxID=47621 RepID=A0A5B6WP93_9ROSI|nr:hypothetical protein EPI10_005859 [Gossypium australe]
MVSVVKVWIFYGHFTKLAHFSKHLEHHRLQFKLYCLDLRSPNSQIKFIKKGHNALPYSSVYLYRLSLGESFSSSLSKCLLDFRVYRK